MLAIVKVQLFGEEDRWRFEFAGFYVGAFFGGLFPVAGLAAVVASFVEAHFFDDTRVSNGDATILNKDLIAIGVIAMVMCVEGEADGLVGDGADFADDQLSPGGEVSIDDQHVVFENDPAIVTDSGCIVGNDVALMKIDIRSKLVCFGGVRRGCGDRAV